MKKAYLEGVRWYWECPVEDCEHMNWIDDKKIFWNDVTPEVKCESCGENCEAVYPLAQN